MLFIKNKTKRFQCCVILSAGAVLDREPQVSRVPARGKLRYGEHYAAGGQRRVLYSLAPRQKRGTSPKIERGTIPRLGAQPVELLATGHGGGIRPKAGTST